MARRRAEGRAETLQAIQRRSGGRCEAGCGAKGKDPHHWPKRSRGGRWSPETVFWLCRRCHDRTDAPYDLGRLIFTGWRDPPGGERRPTFATITKRDKWSYEG